MAANLILPDGIEFIGSGVQSVAVAAPSAWINSDLSINQRVATEVADGAYGFDRTYALTEGSTVGISTLTTPTDGIPYAGRFTQTTVAASRFGFAQIMEARNTYAYRGLDFAFIPKIRTSSTATIRTAILAHLGTPDTLAKDVVNDWNSTNYTAGNFFKSGLSVLDVKSVSCVANTWTDVPSWKTVDSGANNLIMFCWTENVASVNFTLDASLIRAGRGRNIQLWLPPDPAQEMVRCERFYQKIAQGAANDLFAIGMATSSTDAFIMLPVRPMRDGATIASVVNGTMRFVAVGNPSVPLFGITFPGGQSARVNFSGSGMTSSTPGYAIFSGASGAAYANAEIGT